MIFRLYKYIGPTSSSLWNRSLLLALTLISYNEDYAVIQHNGKTELILNHPGLPVVKKNYGLLLTGVFHCYSHGNIFQGDETQKELIEIKNR